MGMKLTPVLLGQSGHLVVTWKLVGTLVNCQILFWSWAHHLARTAES